MKRMETHRVPSRPEGFTASRDDAEIRPAGVGQPLPEVRDYPADSKPIPTGLKRPLPSSPGDVD